MSQIKLSSKMKKLILHIGAPKCGSSALQSSLEILENNGFLGSRGISYPLEHSRGLGHGNADLIFKIIQSARDNTYDFSQAEEYLVSVGNDTVVLSDEKLFGVIAPALSALTKQLSNIFQEIIIYVAIREPSSWLLSDYSQHIKMRVSSRDFIEHTIEREKHCRWLHYLKVLVNQKQNAVIKVTDYKQLIPNMEKNLEFDQGSMSVDRDSTNANISLRGFEMEAHRLAMKLSLNEPEQMQVLKEEFSDFDIYNKNHSLLKYLELKNKDYISQIKTLKGIEYMNGFA